MQLPDEHTDILIHCSKYWPKNSFKLTVTVRDDYTTHGTRWQCTAKTFYQGDIDAYRLKLA